MKLNLNNFYKIKVIMFQIFLWLKKMIVIYTHILLAKSKGTALVKFNKM